MLRLRATPGEPMKDKAAPPPSSPPAAAHAEAGMRAADLFPALYLQLRRVAASYFRSRTAGVSLQPTALVHEAFLKLTHLEPAGFRDRAHLMAVAATAMRQILIDHARRRQAKKRGGTVLRVTLDDSILPGPGADAATAIEILSLDEQLQRLEKLAPRQARVVELLYFGGLTADEVATELAVSKSLVEKEWRRARAFLYSALATE